VFDEEVRTGADGWDGDDAVGVAVGQHRDGLLEAFQFLRCEQDSRRAAKSPPGLERRRGPGVEARPYG
jgi:hypothetical protein